MKKLTLFLLELLLPMCVCASPITEQQAIVKAQQFMQGKTFIHNKGHRLAPKQNSPDAALYVFNAQEGGFVVVSGDDRATPILGYSDNGNLDIDALPEHILSWFNSYADQIAFLQNHPETQVVQKTLANAAPIAPLLGETKWDQGVPYNDLCPVDDEYGYHSATGCVATAMAQIMYYHKWPKQTTKEIPAYTTWTKKIEMPAMEITTIDWDNMLPYYLGVSSSEAQKNAVAKLMLLCGASTEMDYTWTGSGAPSNRVKHALHEYFDYNAYFLSREWYSQEEWNEIIYEELSLGRPVYYDGYSQTTPGHAFVIDGYDKDDYFHVNWGWSGHYDGFFLLNLLNPGNDSFNDDQHAVIGIQKKADIEAYTVYNNNTLTFYHDGQRSSRSETTYAIDLGEYDYYIPGFIRGDRPWVGEYKNITRVVFDSSFSTATPYTLWGWFSDFEALETIEGLENLNVSKVKNLEALFYDCKSLKNLDVSHFNTEKVRLMRWMFDGCSSLTSLDVSNFNTSNVTDLRMMFRGCSNLSKLTLGNEFVTNEETNCVAAFNGCSSLNTVTFTGDIPSSIKSTFFEGVGTADSPATLDVPAEYHEHYAEKFDGNLFYGGYFTFGSTEGMELIERDGQPFDVYSLSGVLVRQGATDLKQLPRGIYIVNSRKVVVR